MDDLKILSQINAYLFKQLDFIGKFYEKFKCFETPKELVDSKKYISNMKNLIIVFKRDFNILEKYTQSSHENISDFNIKNYFNLWKSGKIKKEVISDVFSYNLYNSILNSFLEEFEYIDEEHIASSYYEDKYNEIHLKIKEIESNQFKQSIYLKLNEFNQNNNVKKQKDDWALKISNCELISINEALTNYKDYIFSNKRIFMINFELLPLILNQTFENFFDYALISINDNIDELCNLSVLLRTKNKLITLEKGE